MTENTGCRICSCRTAESLCAGCRADRDAALTTAQQDAARECQRRTGKPCTHTHMW
ncbi:hypothetical protein GCM10012275_53150 [Longimycelium tulufanense]|uniref:Uncharacterized protein n=1 Tax=Longimycelium tulufanense TaxID=907463 RepID=A0A8J3CCY5_9PSEU|nr:hypothetical protein [Longimycelium tulufanense]GGM75791.1 hypothetical protein GCM10012275_53150 [Longimycelium tulufanense]